MSDLDFPSPKLSVPFGTVFHYEKKPKTVPLCIMLPQSLLGTILSIVLG